MKIHRTLEKFAYAITQWSGSTWAFMVALLTIVVWLITGPLFNFSDTWQLVINTSTTIITFLMVFLIQRTQNKEAQAMQLKLNELVASVEGASNRLISVEDLSEEEVVKLNERYKRLAKKAQADEKKGVSHSIDEEEERKRMKQRYERLANKAMDDDAPPEIKLQEEEEDPRG